MLIELCCQTKMEKKQREAMRADAVKQKEVMRRAREVVRVGPLARQAV